MAEVMAEVMAGVMAGVMAAGTSMAAVTSMAATTSTGADILPARTISEAEGLLGMAAKASVRADMQRSDPAISAWR